MCAEGRTIARQGGTVTFSRTVPCILREHWLVETARPGDRRLDTALRASLAWYEDIFRAHRIPTRCQGGLWSSLGDPPRWHSAAKTLHPHVPSTQVLGAVDQFRNCSVADSYATLDLGDHGFRPLFRATWLHRPAPVGPTPSWPDGWTVVSDEDELVTWNEAQDTTDVLVPALLKHPRFTFLARHASDEMLAGAVLHRVDDAVELSNTWSHGHETDDIPSLLDCAGTLHPGLDVVGYSADHAVSSYTDAGFGAVAPLIVWVRDE